MEKFNIITDWYFCQCILAEPVETELFLSLSYQLFSEEPDVNARYHCLGQLAESDIRMQIYSFPRIVQLFSQPGFPAPALDETLSAYFNNLLGIIPLDLSGGFQLIFKTLYAASPDLGTLLVHIKKAADLFAAQSIEKQPAPVADEPYCDLYEHCPQVLLLSICHWIARQDAGLRPRLADDGSLQQLVVQSLDNKYGRQALLLACDIALLVHQGLDQDQLLDAVSGKGDPQLMTQPDLVAQYCRVRFCYGQPGSEAAIAALFREHRYLAEYRQIYLAMHNPGETAALSLALWQDSLVTEAVSLDPAAAASQLSQLWHFSQQPVNARIKLNDPFRGQAVDKEVRDLLVRGKVGSDPVDFDREARSSWLYYSPFLFLRRQGKQLYQRWTKGNEALKTRYVHADTENAWIGLAAAFFNTLRILKTQPKDGSPLPFVFNDLIVHVYHVASDFRPWLRTIVQDRDKEQAAPEEEENLLKLPLPLSALVLTCYRQVSLLASGYCPHIRPEHFISGYYAHLKGGIKGGILSDKTIFDQYIYPLTLTDWIHDAYLSAVPGNPAEAWLQLLPVLYQYILGLDELGSILDQDDKLKTAVLTRYLTSSYQVDPAFDWRTVVGLEWGNPRKWRAHPHYFLLNDTGLQASEWKRDNWQTEPKSIGNGKTTLLIRALERFVAARRNNSSGVITPSVRQGWEEDFRDRVIKIRETTDLNRFIRLRLIEIIADGSLWDGQEDLRNLIVLLLFEFGGAYDLYRLERVLFAPQSGQVLPAGVADQGLQDMLIRTLFATTGIKVVARADNRVPDYFKVRTEASRGEYLLSMKSLIAASEAATIRAIMNRAAEQEQQNLCRTQEMVTNTVSVFSDGRRSGLSKAQLSGPLAFPYTPSSITYNINDKQAYISYQPFREEALVNLFNLDNAERAKTQEFRNVAAVYAGPQDTDPETGLFNCGLGHFVPAGLRGQTLEPGSPVKISRLIRQQGQWQIAGWKKLAPDPQRPFQMLQVTPEQEQGHTRFVLTAGDHGELVIGEDQLADDLFFPDTNAFFRTPGLAYPVCCQLIGDKYQPVPGYLADLLSAHGPDRLITLAYIRVTLEEDRPAWLFSAAPGKNYRLFEADFDPGRGDDLEKIAAAIADLEFQPGGALGLLVSLRAVFNQYRFVLQLEHTAPGMSEQRYTGLACPFDHRNINWRNLFRSATDEAAVYPEGGQCFLRVDPDWLPGFPDIRLAGFNPGDIGKAVAINPRDWQSAAQRSAWIRAEAEPFYTLCGGNTLRILEFIPIYLGWTAGTRIRIQRIIPSNWQEEGALLAFSGEEVPFKLDLESLSMRPIPEQTTWKDKITEIKRRSAVIHRISDWKPLRLKDNSIASLILLAGEEATRAGAQGGRLEGIIVEKPQDPTASQCKVAWVTPAGIVLEMIRLQGLHQLKYNPGCKVTARPTAGGVTCIIYRRDIHVRALWEVRPVKAPLAPGDLFLFEDTEHAYYEPAGSPGTLIAVPHGGKARPKANSLPWETFINAAARFGRSQNRVLLVNKQKAYLAGNSGTINGKYVRNVDYWLEPVGDDRWQLTRNLVLEGRLELDASPQPVPDNRQLQDALLDAYLEAAVVLKGSYDPANQSVRPYADDVFFRDNPWSAQKTPAFRVGPGREPLVSGASYDRDEAEFTLYRLGEQICADLVQEKNFRLPEQFKLEYDQRFSDESIFPLHFVRKKALVHEGRNSEGYLFEWGYGKQLWVPNEQLSYNGVPGSRQPDLFPGDKVLALDWSVIRDGAVTRPVIRIKSLQIDYCQASLLYFQSKNHQVIHVLKVERTADDQLQIKEIMGFAERQNREAYYFQVGSPEFDLDDAATLQLLSHLKKRANPSFQLYARLDTDRYKKDQRIRFKLVNYQQDINDKRNAGSLIPMIVKERVSAGNDTWLQLSPMEAEPGAPQVRLSRRNFSVRENLLAKLPESSLINKIYFVSLGYNNKGPYASLKDTPNRRKSVLADLVRSQGVVIAVAKNCRTQTLEIELKPGVFTELGWQDIAFAEWSSCVDGDRLYIRQLEGTHYPDIRFFVTIASRGDHSFITTTPRPSVLLPWNQLGNKKDLAGKNVKALTGMVSQSTFSVGGLPNVQTRLSGPTREEIILLMSAPHPKAAVISLQQGKPTIGLLADTRCGCLVINTADISLSVQFSRGESAPLPWETVSFAACGVQALASAAKERHWRYHDASTFYWECDPGQVLTGIQHRPISRHNAASGPLFFSEAPGGGFRLRPTVADLLKFAFPVDTLIADLESRPGRTARYAFAARTPGGRYWLELSPGRIAEFAPRLCSYHHGLHKLHLEQFTWNSLSPGDWLTLQLSTPDPAEPEEFRLLQWEPCYRQPLCHRQCHAPATVPDTGECLAGAGAFTLRVPSLRLAPGFEGCITVDAENEISTPAALPQPGDTVFINGQQQVLGFPGLEAIPGDSAFWQTDPLFPFLFPRGEYAQERFRQLTDALGGAIPVTVRKITGGEEPGQLIYNRWHQCRADFIRDGEISLARLIGKLSGQELLFQSGSDLFTAHLQDLIAGVPDARLDEVITHFQQQNLWIRKKGLRLFFGFKPEMESGEVKLEISGQMNGSQSGLIGRSLDTDCYYWMPKAHLSWARIPDALLAACYPAGSVARVVLIPARPADPQGPRIASIVLAKAAVNEFKRFRIGSVIAVQPVAADAHTQLVRAVSSGMVLQSEIPVEELTANRCLVEVTDKSDASFPFFLLSCHDGRNYRLDLPDMAVYDLPALASFSDHCNRLASKDREDLQHLLAEALIPDTELESVPDLQTRLVLIHHCLTLYPESFSGSEAEKAAEIAYQYARRIQRAPSVHLSYALLAVLVTAGLDGHQLPARYAHTALTLTRNLCQRSARSLHVPAILRELVIDQLAGIKTLSVLAGSRNIYERLIDLQPDIKKKYLNEKILLKIIYFCGLISYRATEARQDIEVLVSALLTAAGHQADIPLLLEGNPAHRELLKLQAIWNQHGPEMRLTRCHLDILQKVLAYTINSPVILLDILFPQG